MGKERDPESVDSKVSPAARSAASVMVYCCLVDTRLKNMASFPNPALPKPSRCCGLSGGNRSYFFEKRLFRCLEAFRAFLKLAREATSRATSREILRTGHLPSHHPPVQCRPPSTSPSSLSLVQLSHNATLSTPSHPSEACSLSALLARIRDSNLLIGS